MDVIVTRKFSKFPRAHLQVAEYQLLESDGYSGARLAMEAKYADANAESPDKHRASGFIVEILPNDVNVVKQFLSMFAVESVHVCDLVIDDAGKLLAFGINQFIPVESGKAVVKRITDAAMAFCNEE